MSNEEGWPGPLAQAVRRYSIVFVHLGTAWSSMRNELDQLGAVLGVADYLADGPPATVGCVVLRDVESLIASRSLTFGKLRESVINDVDNGYRFVLQSRVARGAFPETPGSNLLADAKHVYATPAAERAAQGVERLPGWADWHADGSRDKQAFLKECIAELGVDTVSFLSELIWDSRLSPRESLGRIGGVDGDSLRSAGLTWLSSGEADWVIGPDWKKFREALALVASSYVDQGPWLSRAFADLWLVERLIRNAVRDALIIRQGSGWRSTCLPDGLRSEVVGRAQADSQPAAEKVSDLRDPLEWLSTSELLDLRETRELGSLGLDPPHWNQLRHALLPIRNRAAHMRVIAERDARTLSTWRSVLERKLGPDEGSYGSGGSG